MTQWVIDPYPHGAPLPLDIRRYYLRKPPPLTKVVTAISEQSLTPMSEALCDTVPFVIIYPYYVSSDQFAIRPAKVRSDLRHRGP